MKKHSAILICLVIPWLAACTSARPSNPRPLSVALAVAIANGSNPAPKQIATIHAAMAGYLIRAGYTLAGKNESPDLIVTVRFTPDAADPVAGHITIVRVEPAAEFRDAAANSTGSDPAKEALRAMRTIQDMVDSRISPST